MQSAGALGSAFLGIFSPVGRAISAMREKIQWEWVDHSALLKKLVREFREGDTAQALRRAIPISPTGRRPCALDSGADELAALDAGGVQPGRAAATSGPRRGDSGSHRPGSSDP